MQKLRLQWSITSKSFRRTLSCVTCLLVPSQESRISDGLLPHRPMKSALHCLFAVLLTANLAIGQAIRFENKTKGSGLNFVLDNGTTDDKPIIDGVLGGLPLLEYDNDAHLDIFSANGARIPGLPKDNAKFFIRLYR